MAPQEHEEEQGEQGFTVSDKRLFTKEGQKREAESRPETPRASAPPPPTPPIQEAPPVQESPRFQPETEEPPLSELPPPVDFSTFVAILANNIMMLLGQVPDPVTQQRHLDLPQAKHTIDILIMLREKTKGNLSAEEVQLLEELLPQLQMAYVSVSKQVG